jgi:hypothetical protein
MRSGHRNTTSLHYIRLSGHEDQIKYINIRSNAHLYIPSYSNFSPRVPVIDIHMVPVDWFGSVIISPTNDWLINRRTKTKCYAEP